MSAPSRLTITLPEGTASRLDKALAAALPVEAGLSRSRLQLLIAGGAVTRGGQTAHDPKTRVAAGEVWEIALPDPEPLDIRAEAIPLDIVHEDADLIVIDKPAGMVVHPAPGVRSGTLVNALLHHCGDSLSGIGGMARPGIVHRIDKDTTGLLVVAKSDVAHQGLSRQFSDHSVERLYDALVWGVPSPRDPRVLGLAGVSAKAGALRIETQIGRHPADRKKMAVLTSGGRHAVTHLRVPGPYGPASLVECRLETGRTHQIRVHMTYLGHPLLGDPVYGAARKAPKDGDLAEMIAALPGQALHARTLGFDHPVSGKRLDFEAPRPELFNRLLTRLGDGSAAPGRRTS